MTVLYITLLLVLISLIIYLKNKNIKLEKKIYDEISGKIKKEINTYNEIKNNIALVEIQERSVKEKINQKKEELENINFFIEKTEKENKEIQKEKFLKELEIEKQEYLKNFNDTKNNLEEQILNIKNELEDLQNKRNSIIEAQRKELELKNKRNFYNIQLSDENKEDITYLLNIEAYIHNKQIFRKFIWSEYLQKPFQDMIKRIFGNNIPSNVIYCIEDSEGKKYIGKTSSEVNKRWSDHIKTSLGIGSVATSKIHPVLFKNWENFSFYILEQTTKEKLNEREKYWIKFYQSDIFGYNIKSGG